MIPFIPFASGGEAAAHGGGGFFSNLAADMYAGGWPLIPVGLICLFSAIIIVERFIVLYILSFENKDGLLRGLQGHILKGDVPAAIRFIDAQRQGPLSRIIKAGLVRINKGDKEVQAALDEASLREVPYLEKRTGFLAVFSNATTLVGLLGTIIGMIHCFASVAYAEPAEKASLLSAGIAEAMTCTKYGLGSAIVILIIYAVLQARTQQIIDRINETVVSVLNLALANKQAIRSAADDTAKAR